MIVRQNQKGCHVQEIIIKSLNADQKLCQDCQMARSELP